MLLQTEGEVRGKNGKKATGWNESGDTLKLFTPKVNVCTNTALSGIRKTKLQQGQKLLTVTKTANSNYLPYAAQHTTGST